MAQRRVEWRGVDDPSRRDAALVRFEPDRLVAAGASVADGWTSGWSLDTARGWATTRLVVHTQGPGWARSLELVRDDRGRWAARASVEGGADLPDPGLRDPRVLDGAVDCDLGLNPLTNTMPIRRLGLLTAAVPETPLVTALVEVPSLAVEASPQVYASAGLRLGAEVAFATADGGFRAVLGVDEDGVVVDYPGLARRPRPDER